MAQPATSRKEEEEVVVAGFFGEEQGPGGRMRGEPTHGPLKAQLRSASGRSSKVIKDREAIEAVVEVPEVGRLVLRVDSAGGFSLRGRPADKEAGEATSRDLIVVGMMRADGIVAVRPEESSAES